MRFFAAQIRSRNGVPVDDPRAKQRKELKHPLRVFFVGKQHHKVIAEATASTGTPNGGLPSETLTALPWGSEIKAKRTLPGPRAAYSKWRLVTAPSSYS
jgi:hypothetical protein